MVVLWAAFLSGCGGGSGGPPPNPLFVSSTQGDDGNTGDALMPLRTINEAARIALDAYTIVVAPGTYNEQVTTDRAGTPAQGLQFVADTTCQIFNQFAGAPCSKDEPVTVQAPSDTLAVAFKLNNSLGAVIDGFTVTGGGGGGIVVNGSDEARVQNCIAFNNRGPNGDGIRVQASANVVVFNNLSFGNSVRGIAIVGDPGAPDAMVVNNTVARNGSIGIDIGTNSASSPRAFLRNNIVYDNSVDANPSDPRRQIVVRVPSDEEYDGNFNLVMPAVYVPETVEGLNDISSDPRFFDDVPVMPSDFRLLLDSPAIDRSPNFEIGDPLRFCLQKWATVVTDTPDTGATDLGYHRVLTDPHCGVAVPTPTPTS